MPRTVTSDALNDAANALSTLKPEGEQISGEAAERRFKLGDRVRKIKGSSWQGVVVGFYSTKLTPVGYNVESEREPGSVQLYPEAALEPVDSGDKTHE
ncbi:DfrB family trimethoprim-resistant dihydrofolate reductase [Phyllobacterium trifolii]